MLEICKLFFEYLNSRKIRYCHWKSNAHLEKALAGKTDLDLLVHRDDRGEFEEALGEFVFKKILSPPEKCFDGLEDFLGFDQATGSLVHLHIHYKLVLGQRYIKNHHLPIEELIFENLIVQSGVFIPCPELELLLLIIRAHMKIDQKSLLKHWIKNVLLRDKGYTAFPADIEAELSDLISKNDALKFKEILHKTKLPLAEIIFTRFIVIFSEKEVGVWDIVKNHYRILSGLKEFRRSKSVLVYLKYCCFFSSEILLRRGLMKPKRKTIHSGGRIISLVGADGSGKSTLIKDLEKWLSWKLSVAKFYYGIPKTKRIVLLAFAMRVFRKIRLGFGATFLECVLWTYIAKQRFRISLLALNEAKRGHAVIMDRFPLKVFHDMPEPMDGPRLSRKVSKMGLFFSRKERYYYDKISLPDRIFVLQVTIDELRKRKTDLNLETHIIKADAVNSISGDEKTVLIDANKPYSDVLLDIKRKIWALL